MKGHWLYIGIAYITMGLVDGFYGRVVLAVMWFLLLRHVVHRKVRLHVFIWLCLFVICSWPMNRKINIGTVVSMRNGYQVKGDYSDVVNEPLYRDSMEICEDILEAFENNEFGEVYLAYTRFKNTVVHVPTMLKLLPVSAEDENLQGIEKLTLMNYEPNEEEALDAIVPKYMTSLIYGALIEAVASENGARMQAMDSATSNADEMIENLSLLYNRARQSSITQELTEIIAGADAIS